LLIGVYYQYPSNWGNIPDLQDGLSCYWKCPELFTVDFKWWVQHKYMGLNILPISVIDNLNSTITLGGSSIFRPMIKFHAVGQDKYTKVYITVYIHAAIFVESSTIFSATD
jgi:hypothetical protein